MKKEDIKKHLSIYSIYNKRRTTINQRPLNIPCQSNSDRRNPITPELKF